MIAPANRPRVHARTGESIGATLPRRLDTSTSTALIVGFVIGSGIFGVPSRVAAEAGGVAPALLAWAVGGAIALCGALSLAELGAMFPRAGGVYTFLYEAYGPALAFLKGWVHLVIGPSAWAAVALIFAEYARSFLPMSDAGIHGLAAGVIALLAIMGCRSIKVAAALQMASTWTKVVALLTMAVVLLANGRPHATVMTIGSASRAWSGFGLALIPVLYAYDGWNGFTAMAGEVRNPARTIPFSLFLGVTTVTVVYLTVNIGFFAVLPFRMLQQSPHVAADAMASIGAPASVSVAAALVMLSTFSALNATVMLDPRIYFAMAESGLFFRRVASIHPRWGTPHIAIMLNALLAIVYVFVRSFDELAETFVLGLWPFLALAVAAVFVLRHTRPHAPRPYRVIGYPLVPFVFLIASIAMLLNVCYRHPLSSLISFGVCLSGLPVYWAWRYAERHDFSGGPPSNRR